MGGLFGGSKAPPGPSPEELERQVEREARAEARETEEKRKIASRQISRSRRNRMLMSVMPPEFKLLKEL